MSSGCASFGNSKPPPPSTEVRCPPAAYEWAEGPLPPAGVTLEETEVEDSANRARWGRDIVRHNTSALCLRLRDGVK